MNEFQYIFETYFEQTNLLRRTSDVCHPHVMSRTLNAENDT